MDGWLYGGESIALASLGALEIFKRGVAVCVGTTVETVWW
jgi:hypothetical protein